MDVKAQSPLAVSSLNKSYGSFTAVKDVTFAMEPGEVFGLLGPNGAGKTSIISCVVTLQKPDQGSVKIFGNDPIENPLPAKMLTGYVPQEIINHGYFTVEEILVFHSGFFRTWYNRERIHYLLHRLALFDHRNKKVKTLSGGMKRRLLIAKALVHNPKLLLLDEPTAGVDIELRASLWDFVRELKKDGLSVLLTTHYLEEAEELCDRVGILQQGQLRQVGATKGLIEQLTERHVSLSMKKEAHPGQAEKYLIKKSANHMEFLIPQNLGVGELLLQTGCRLEDLEDLRIREGSLEEAFVRILGENGQKGEA